MTITRYGLGREYAGNTGSPAITEQADGAYVRYEDFQRMEAAHKAHNEMLVLRTKKAEAAKDGALIDEGTKSAQPNHNEDARHLAEPSDDELAALWDKIHALFGREPFRIGHVDFARALLAKYGSKP